MSTHILKLSEKSTGLYNSAGTTVKVGTKVESLAIQILPPRLPVQKATGQTHLGTKFGAGKENGSQASRTAYQSLAR